MTDPAVPEPILVNATAAPDQWAAGIRYALMAASSVAGALGWVKMAGDASALLAAAGPVGMLLAFLWGQYKTRQQSLKMTVMAHALPDEIAQVKKP